MNDLLSRIKTLDYKQFALNHGEKIGMGLAGLVVGVVCLFLTGWASDFTGDPHKMEADADDVPEKLKRNLWTEERQKEFPLRLAANEMPKVIEPLPFERFEWLRDPSPKLYQEQQPADEVGWLAAVDLVARFGHFPMGTNPPAPPADATDDDAKSRPARPDRPSSKKRDRGDDLLAQPMPAADGSGYGDSGEKASGRRFVTVLAVVEVRRQLDALRRAMHTNSMAEVKDRLNYRGFKLQRQRAVPGLDPWPKDEKSWKDVNPADSISVILEASEQEAEVVAAKFTNVEFTSPIPRRLDGEWDPNLIVHPRIPTLPEEQRKVELEMNKAALEAVKQAGEIDQIEGGGTGFAAVTKDANRLRRQAQTGAGSQAFNDSMSAMKNAISSAGYGGARGGNRGPGGGPGGGAMAGPPDPSTQRRGAGSGSGAYMGPTPPSAMGAAGMPGPGGGPMATGVMGMGIGGMGIGGMGIGGMGMGMGTNMPGAFDAGAEIQLFRYFDFDVEPGECYRYRVKLIVDNPSFEDTFVAQPTVAQGKIRETPWSAPSPPAVVEKDVEYGLAKVTQTRGHNDGVELNVVQFDANFGSYIMDTFKVVYGSYVGALKKTSHLDFVAQSVKEEEVKFSSSDVLLDSIGTPARFSDAVLGDLKLDAKKSKKLLDMAVTLNRFGELEELDAGSIDGLKAAKDRVEAERKPFKEDLQESGKNRNEKKSALDQALEGKDKKKGKSKGREKTANPLKGGYPGPGGSLPMGAGGVAPAPRGRGR